MTYTQGNFHIAANKDQVMAAGFKPSIYLIDGSGIAVGPSTGVRVPISNQKSIYGNEFGLTNDYQMTEPFNRLMTVNAGVWQARIGDVIANHNAYRQEQIQKRIVKERYVNFLIQVIYHPLYIGIVVISNIFNHILKTKYLF